MTQLLNYSVRQFGVLASELSRSQLSLPHLRFRIIAPSRLHFGLFAANSRSGPQFGGVGVMLDDPNVIVDVEEADEFLASGIHESRVRQLAQRWHQAHSRVESLKCRLNVVSCPRQHVGLGVGTQLGLAVALALRLFAGLERVAASELAREVGRGARSAVGTHGFHYGGLLLEDGKLDANSVSPLNDRTDLPAEWRFVLICERSASGVSGNDESTAFCQLPHVPAETTQRLRRTAYALLDHARKREFREFSQSLYDYGFTAGTCFSAVQGGPYNGAVATRCVQFVRQSGIAGVSQSSWGPTIFALTENSERANELAIKLSNEFGETVDVQIASPNNCGVKVTG